MSNPRKWPAALAGPALVAVLVATLTAPTAVAQADEPIQDPLPDPTPSALGIVVEEFAQFPKTEPVPPPTDGRLMRHARINHLGEIPDGSERMYVPDLNGKVYLVGDDGEPNLYLDVGAEFAPEFISGRGLGSGSGFVTFHPDFERNGKLYTVHTEWGAGLDEPTTYPEQPNAAFHGVITEWTADDPDADTFSGTHRQVMRLGFRTQIHGFQQIDFNPTARRGSREYGVLYLAAGDGGLGASTTDPQDTTTPYGKLLRIDPLGGNGPGGTYGIPRDNPFAGDEGVLGEIYALGMRDPHRFSWDTATRRMYLGHIGEHRIESVYEVRPGDNFGWSEREGPFVFRRGDPDCGVYPLPEDDERYGYTYPVAAFDHNPPPGHPLCSDSGHAISGGFVYRGRDVPGLRGKYLFTDLVDGRVFATESREMRRGHPMADIHQLAVYTADGERTTFRELAGDERVDLRFGRDAEGELYLLAKANGKVWKVTGTRWAPHGPDVVAYYDFEHPVAGNLERDLGVSGTDLALVNGGAAMRVPDRGGHVLVTRQEPGADDDWKAGVYSATGVRSLHAFNAAREVTVMGWFKVTGDLPAPNTNTPDPDDRYNAVGLAGVLSGDSDGHAVRALLEVIDVDGEPRVVALGRRVDGARSQTFAANADWREILPRGRWVHLAATFDFDTGELALYRNGRPLDGFYTVPGDPWAVDGAPEPDLTTASDPAGIKIGGSFPQNTGEANPCDCRMDDLMFLDRALSPPEVWLRYLLTR
ncbi:PQQ-dependent sugar dehydrogenase [Actinophytocola gossypii]|uniref:PQQ-dependent sugar dehydrogenase n=1 Tax=Actinophytocola gossypii TaxID=2812003 RepID=A0ABT2JIY4_9PSEU|nr:PQQ-dependent sugar dehydrogenase [Actinophytocola gossypii]MCT2587842.1 PQQ-dependent sugar dehydrogenase [Actinophytocola gossypii]